MLVRPILRPAPTIVSHNQLRLRGLGPAQRDRDTSGTAATKRVKQGVDHQFGSGEHYGPDLQGGHIDRLDPSSHVDMPDDGAEQLNQIANRCPKCARAGQRLHAIACVQGAEHGRKLRRESVLGNSAERISHAQGQSVLKPADQTDHAVCPVHRFISPERLKVRKFIARRQYSIKKSTKHGLPLHRHRTRQTRHQLDPAGPPLTSMELTALAHVNLQRGDGSAAPCCTKARARPIGDQRLSVRS